MAILIDGYNLMYASDVFPAGGPPTLERVREALLDHLAQLLPAKELARTIIVFDAAQAPPGLPRELVHRGLAVRFARRGGSADELLEELIAAEPDPRNLLVVSSDHRVQRTARQRGANYTDSQPWHAQLAQDAKSRAASEKLPPAAGESEKEQLVMPNPFPPGYASDLLGDSDD
jgi:predicted RNA-binding protein with PIN domain